MPTLYTWLFFVHVLAVGTFLFAHGVSGGASFLLRGPVSQQTRSLLRLSQRRVSRLFYPAPRSCS